MSDEELLDRWRRAFEQPALGWSFDDLAARMEVEEPPWSYERLARDVLADAGSALDLGTGGGEVLLSLLDALPPDTTASEGWPPNLPVATQALAPYGIEVVFYDAEGAHPRLPFLDGRFDVVLDRHEAYLASEVARVLRPGGVFLTQQVDGRDLAEVRALFGSTSAYDHVTLPVFRTDLERAGLTVEVAREWSGRMRFADVETFCGYARRVPWEVPDDFSVDRYAAQLLRMHEQRLLDFTTRRFVLVARRPASA